jgi:hypothetical protein
VNRVDFLPLNETEQGGHAFRALAADEPWFEEITAARNWPSCECAACSTDRLLAAAVSHSLLDLTVPFSYNPTYEMADWLATSLPSLVPSVMQ